MGVVLIGEAFGQFFAYLLVALVFVYSARKADRPEAPHWAAFSLIAVIIFAVNYQSERGLLLGIFVLALIATFLQWTYHRASARAPNGFTRLYAIFVGLAEILVIWAIGSSRGEEAAYVAGIGGGALLMIFAIRFLSKWVWRGFVPERSHSAEEKA